MVLSIYCPRAMESVVPFVGKILQRHRKESQLWTRPSEPLAKTLYKIRFAQTKFLNHQPMATFCTRSCQRAARTFAVAPEYKLATEWLNAKRCV